MHPIVFTGDELPGFGEDQSEFRVGISRIDFFSEDRVRSVGILGREEKKLVVDLVVPLFSLPLAKLA